MKTESEEMHLNKNLARHWAQAQLFSTIDCAVKGENCASRGRYTNFCSVFKVYRASC